MSLLAAIASSRRRSTAFSPLSLSPALWLDASDASTLWDATSGGSLVASNGAIARWEDKSGNAKHALQTTAANRPLRKIGIKNGMDTVRFDGINDGLQVASITLPTYITAYVIQRSDFSSSNLKFWFEHGANVNNFSGCFFNGMNSGAWAFTRDGAYHSGPSSDGQDWSGVNWILATLKYDGIGSFYKNGNLVSNTSHLGTSRANSNLTEKLNIGCRNLSSLFLSGDIAEMLIYPSVHSDVNKSLVETYLTSKWLI